MMFDLIGSGFHGTKFDEVIFSGLLDDCILYIVKRGMVFHQDCDDVNGWFAPKDAGQIAGWVRVRRDDCVGFAVAKY